MGARNPSSVNGYTGQWGSGKTLAMAEHCLELQAQGVLIASNFAFYTADYTLATMEEWLRLVAYLVQQRQETGLRSRVHIAIDEMGMLLEQGDMKSWPSALNIIFQQGRKFGITMDYTVPDFALVHANLRRVTGYVTVCQGHGIKRLSAPGEPLEVGARYFSRRLYPAAAWGTAKCKQIGFATYRRLPKAAAASYDTYGIIETTQKVLEAQIKQYLNTPAPSLIVRDRLITATA